MQFTPNGRLGAALVRSRAHRHSLVEVLSRAFYAMHDTKTR